MKRSSIVLIVIGVLVLFLVVGGCNSYNGMNSSRVNVDEKWAGVQSSYQRRADLIPNLVSTVKGAAEFEKSTLTAVIEARAKATQMNVNAGDLTPEKMKEFQQAQGQVSQALGRLMVVSEQYPQLKANQNFLALQDQLEGTENRIKVSRDDFNVAVKDYNLRVTAFPGRIFASMFGFKERPMFQSEAGAEKAPKVEF